tara:strand:+ start:8126 stop:9490 length:1365 start_codon:yes stop_codon:yes gene_type:complete
MNFVGKWNRIGKDAGGYGNLDMANQHESDKETPIRLGRDDEESDNETYIGLPAKKDRAMTLNKIQHTRVGDDIHFYINGEENRGVVVKMGGTYVSVFKEDGYIHEIPINETFFVKDIVVNKTWDDMTQEERTKALIKAKVPSPRFLHKNWDDLPRTLQDVLRKGAEDEMGDIENPKKKLGRKQREVHELEDKAVGMEQNHDGDNLEKESAEHRMTGYAQKSEEILKRIQQLKSDVEHGAYGNAARNPHVGVSTDTSFDAPKDYEAGSEPNEKEQFKHEKKKPSDKKKGNSGEGGQTGALNTSEGAGFNPVYNAYDTNTIPEETKTGRKISGRDQLKKGIPVKNVNTWGIKYVAKDSFDDMHADDPSSSTIDNHKRKRPDLNFRQTGKPCSHCGKEGFEIEVQNPNNENKDWFSLAGTDHHDRDKIVCPTCDAKQTRSRAGGVGKPDKKTQEGGE